MLVAAAVCPCPPLLVPEVAGGAAAELDAARAACADALAVLAAARPGRLVVVGPALPEARGAYPEGSPGSFHGFGVDLAVRLGRAAHPGHDGRALPPSLAVGAWLLAEHRWDAAPVEGLGIGELLEPPHCAATGAELARDTDRLALLIMGDGSACRTPKAPGAFDERAAAFDADAAAALGRADLDALAGLDAGLARELRVAGRSGWQLLAGAARGADLAGALLYDDAPYGVGYCVAAWS
ncbi:class III extradiol dioxygenase subunit B-like domain-containing protein [Streptomyces sp. XM4011]|uniref:class III extradiol dioxygenase subunit B-like domain-containing protein n=1 Tax=Streptomyces TaxID=1883 RepID=UPI0002D4C2A1|nr:MULTISPECIES: class III extradiol dioxygenase subunit B-like domain-containing protein [Streptomyces]MCK1813657.1 class III extradiol dioxygenase subunit B-like domain-containing protein [Streptomyces sp. XM4011]